jgi:beta-galactosidase
MPKTVQQRDADILKHELGVNLVRSSHYPPSRHFLDRCDALGLLVFEEIPGWQHIWAASWKQVAIKNTEEMIRRDWNHPSIILWGVRINESGDDDAFYQETNRLAHALDATRQTGGCAILPEAICSRMCTPSMISATTGVPLRCKTQDG